MEEFFRRNLASLSPSELRVAVAMMVAPYATNSELKRLSGVTGNTSFYHALKTLQERGYSQSRSIILPHQEFNSQVRSITLPVQEYTPLPVQEHSQSRSEALPVQEYDSQDRSDEVDFEKALELADDLPGDGDERNPHSNFQIRRKQQMQLLQEAWADLFGQELHHLAAKELLQKAHSQALDVFYAMQKAAERNIERPLGYVKKILENTKPKPIQTDEEGLLPVTAEIRKQWDENEKLVASWTEGWNL